MQEQRGGVSRPRSPGTTQAFAKTAEYIPPHTNKTARLFRTGRQGIAESRGPLGCFQLLDVFYHHRLRSADLQFACEEVNHEAGHNNQRAEHQPV